MAYIGNTPAEKYSAFQKQDFTTSATTSYTLDNPVANANELALFINFVRQEPTTAYSASGTSLTLTSATSASDDMYCVFLGKAVQTVNPPNGSVGTAQLASTAVIPAKMDLSQDYTFTGKISGQNYPAFQASLSTGASQVIPSATWTKGIFSNEHFDTDNAYDTSNGRFTVPTGKGGVYHVMTNVLIDDIDNLTNAAARLYKNGVGTTNPTVQGQMYGSGGAQNWFVNYSMTITLAESDYIESFVFQSTTTNQNLRSSSSFGAYRIGD